MTLPSRHRIRNSSPGGLRPGRQGIKQLVFLSSSKVTHYQIMAFISTFGPSLLLGIYVQLDEIFSSLSPTY